MFHGPPAIRVQLSAQRDAPVRARQAVRELLCDLVPTRVTEDAMLLTSEIVSNAALIGGCELWAWFSPEDGHLRVEVHDPSSEMPILRDPRMAGQITGRGLQIVDALASNWGVLPRDSGKAVWFEISTAAA